MVVYFLGVCNGSSGPDYDQNGPMGVGVLIYISIKQIQSFLVSGVTIDILGECGGSTWLKSPEMRESAWQLDVCN